MNADWMIYGAYGYTGELISRLAAERGMQPILAGRNEARTRELAESLGLSWRSFSLENSDDVKTGIQGCKLVLHCAGPFSATSAPMLNACLDAGTHYLDITGEIDVFAAAHQHHEQARKKDVVILPGAGFDVVPTDCLAATLVQKLPSATHLTLAFEAGGGPSAGTAKSAVEGMGKGGRVRQDGMLTTVPLAWKTRQIPFAEGDRLGVTIPWGDVFTSYISTGIPNVEVYLSVPPSAVKKMRSIRKFKWLLGLGPVQSFLKKRIENKVAGPDNALRENTQARVWAEVSSSDGRSVSGQVNAPNGYSLTADAALGITTYLLENNPEGGFYTPSLLMGADYVSNLQGVEMQIAEIDSSK
ncbi:MAG: saccharopine dehydrogenase NADP-binding domain-containing protein [Xanthomonadales bacterium]|nr:saccharopine dehydrogenase NADP-binding domain-containing protein [Xanthomonadales bacterium]